jgi:hypothetical protein
LLPAYSPLSAKRTDFPVSTTSSATSRIKRLPFSGSLIMCSENVTLEPVEKRVEEELGRELTPREKFYLALAEACTPPSDRSQDVNTKKQAEASL